MQLTMTGIIGYHVGEAIRVRVEIFPYTEAKKFSLDPEITSFEMLQNLLAKIFDIEGEFSVTYLHRHRKGNPLYVTLSSDWDLDVAIQVSSQPFLHLRVEKIPKERGLEDWDVITPIDVPSPTPDDLLTKPSFAVAIITQVERTFRLLQKAFHLNEIDPPKSPMTETEFRSYLDNDGRLVRPKELRLSVFRGGIEPSLRSVVWKHILNVYSQSFTTSEQLAYLAEKSKKYEEFRDIWRHQYQKKHLTDEVRRLINNVWKDVLRTDRTHKYFSGSNNEHLTSLFNVLTTFALTHPSVSYCQGMSDIASPLLVTMKHEGHAYLCFCSLMERLRSNFNHDGRSMMMKFKHLSLLLMYYDSEFYDYLTEQGATDLIFCYRWLLLELKREFVFDDSLHMLEVSWSSLPPPSLREHRLSEVQESDLIESLMCEAEDRSRHCSGYDTAGDTSSLELSFKEQHFGSSHHSLIGNDDHRSQISSHILDDGDNMSNVSNRNDSEDKRNYINSTHISNNGHKTYISNCILTDSGNHRNHVSNCSVGDSRVSCCDCEGPKKSYSEGQAAYVPDVSLCDVTFEDYKTFSPTSKSSDGYLSGDDSSSEQLNQDECYYPDDKSAFLDSGTTDFTCRNRIILPDPHELGCGNPFVLFLSLAILLQHRDIILCKQMDYNDIAMHFDKLVRKHNVHKVLCQARAMFTDYLRLGWEDSSDTIKP